MLQQRHDVVEVYRLLLFQDLGDLQQLLVYCRRCLLHLLLLKAQQAEDWFEDLIEPLQDNFLQ